MGKSLPSAAAPTNLRNLKNFARVASERLRSAKSSSRAPPPVLRCLSSPEPARSSSDGPDRSSGAAAGRGMETAEEERTPLSEVVADCVKRWFQDTLKEAKAGDVAMQVLVGQMYYSGYGVQRNVQKGKAWISKASHSRSSVWKVSDKHPGYNASDSDSDELKDEEK